MANFIRGLSRQRVLQQYLTPYADDAASRAVQGETSYSALEGFFSFGGYQLQRAQQFAKRARDSGLKAYNPITPGLRGRVVTTRENLWRGGPLKALSFGMSKTGGRNSAGRITAWHRGGGAKKIYRIIDFKRADAAASGVVERLEYDPNRTARIALVRHTREAEDRRLPFSYMLAPQSIKAGDSVSCGPGAGIRPGNSLPLSLIPLGSVIHNIELLPGKGGQIARAAGTSATLVSRGEGEKAYAVIKMPSGEQRSVLAGCTATIGVLSNPQHKNRKLGKAGAARRHGRRPVVRGVAMNSVDHPHGGGRGKSKGRISQTPWGVPTKGYKTRKPRNRTDHFIQLSRHKLTKR